MGMSTHLTMFRSPDDPKLKAGLGAAYACKRAGVPIPQELVKYLAPVFEEYGGLPKDEETAVEAMLTIPLKNRNKYKWSNDYASGFEVDLSDLPEGVSKIRFYCAW